MVGEVKKTISEAEIAELVQKEIAAIDTRLVETEAILKPLNETLSVLTRLEQAEKDAIKAAAAARIAAVKAAVEAARIAATKAATEANATPVATAAAVTKAVAEAEVKAAVEAKAEAEVELIKAGFEELGPWLSHGNVQHLEQIDQIYLKKAKGQVDIGKILLDLDSKRNEISAHKQSAVPIGPEDKKKWVSDLTQLNIVEAGLRRQIKKEIKDTLQAEASFLEILKEKLVKDKKNSAIIERLEKRPLTPESTSEITNLKQDITKHAQERASYYLEVKNNTLQNNSETVSQTKKKYTADIEAAKRVRADIKENKNNIKKLESEIKDIQRKILSKVEETQRQILAITDIVREKQESDKVPEVDGEGIPLPPGPPGAPPGPSASDVPVRANREQKEEKNPSAEPVQNPFLGMIGPDNKSRLRSTPKVETKVKAQLNLKEKVKLKSSLEKREEYKKQSSSSEGAAEAYKDMELLLTTYLTKESANKTAISSLEDQANRAETELTKKTFYIQILDLQQKSIRALEDLKHESRLQLEEIENKYVEVSKIRTELTVVPEEENLAPPPPPPSFDLEVPQKLTKGSSSTMVAKEQVQKQEKPKLDAESTQKAFAKGAELTIKGFLAAQVIKILDQKGVDKDSNFQKRVAELIPELTAEKSTETSPSILELNAIKDKFKPEKKYQDMTESEKRILNNLVSKFLTVHENYQELTTFAGAEKGKEEARQEVLEEASRKRAMKAEQELTTYQEELARKKLESKLGKILKLNPVVNLEKVKKAESQLRDAQGENPREAVYKRVLEENRNRIKLLGDAFTPELAESIAKILAQPRPAPAPAPEEEAPGEVPHDAPAKEAPGAVLDDAPAAAQGSDAVAPKPLVPHPSSQGFFAEHKHHGGPALIKADLEASKNARAEWIKQFYFGGNPLDVAIGQIGNKFLEKGDERTAQLLYRVAVKSRVAKEDFIEHGHLDVFAKYYKDAIQLVTESEKKSNTGALAWIKNVFQNIVDTVTGKAGIRKEMQAQILQKFNTEYGDLFSMIGEPNPKPDSSAPRG